jgi:hypothetical protein
VVAKCQALFSQSSGTCGDSGGCIKKQGVWLPEVEVKPQLEDTSISWKNNIRIYKRELSAAQEVHELDAQTGQVLPHRHEMEGSLEKLQVRGSEDVIARAKDVMRIVKAEYERARPLFKAFTAS